MSSEKTDKTNPQILPSSKALLGYKPILDAIPDPILIADKTVQIIYVNPAWEELTGYKLSEVLGENPRFLRSGKTPEGVYRELWHQLKKSGSFTTEDIVDRRKDDTHYRVRSIFFSLSNEAGETDMYIQIQHDITKRKAIEEVLKASETRLQEHIKELERLNKILVGREIKMIELKKELNALKEERRVL